MASENKYRPNSANPTGGGPDQLRRHLEREGVDPSVSGPDQLCEYQRRESVPDRAPAGEVTGTVRPVKRDWGK